MKKKIKEFVCDSISCAWSGIVIGGGIALGFVAVISISGRSEG